MLLKLTTVPSPILRQKSLTVPQMNTKNAHFLEDMANTLIRKTDPAGVGLSAVQVGTPTRIFMTYLPPQNDLSSLDGKHPPQELKIFINPEIIDKSEELTLGPDPKHPALEGCLSIPNLYGPVPRHQTITIKYQTLADSRAIIDERAQADAFRHSSTRGNLSEGEIDLVEKTETFSNFFARVVQHEYDHLDAILFTDYTLKHNLPLYFDQGEHLTEIPKPEELIKW